MSGFEIRTTPEKGRSIYATKHYKTDEVLFEESPIVACQFSWNFAYKYLACEYCLRPLETSESNVRRLSGSSVSLPFPQFCPTNLQNHTKCENCGANYCSEACKIEAFEKYHATLCLGDQVNNLEHPLNKLNESWKLLHYPPETSSILLIAKLLAMIKQSNNRVELLSKLSEFQAIAVNKDQKILHKLLKAENFTKDLETLYRLTLAAFNSEEYSQYLSPEGFQSLFALIATNGQGIGSSPFAEWEKKVTQSLDNTSDEYHAVDTFINDLYTKMDEVSGVFLNNEGSGLFCLQSKINHSCVPNAEITFPYSNHVLSVKLLNDVKPGEEITISYLDDCMLDRSRHSRQKELRENYLFNCQCPMCIGQINEPDVTSDEDDEEAMED